MKIKAVLWCAFTVLCTQMNLALGGPILNTVGITPSELNSSGSSPGTNYVFTNIACTDAYTGLFISCGYDFSITGLTQPESDPANNGGHTHDYSSHPLGKLKVLLPNPGLQSTTLNGFTQNNYVYFSHEIPSVSGKIETVLNLRVPPGWSTVYPQSCNGNGTSWCFDTTVDVGVTGLIPLPDAPFLYTKVRKPNPDLNHSNAVAYYATPSAISNLNSIAAWYDYLTFGYSTLSINDMSLIRGGLFDINHDYSRPHSWHRTGESADINKDANGDCTKNKTLLIAVYIVMGRGVQPVLANRKLPSFGHFLCETGVKFKNSNNIHIDL